TRSTTELVGVVCQPSSASNFAVGTSAGFFAATAMNHSSPFCSCEVVTVATFVSSDASVSTNDWKFSSEAARQPDGNVESFATSVQLFDVPAATQPGSSTLPLTLSMILTRLAFDSTISDCSATGVGSSWLSNGL